MFLVTDLYDLVLSPKYSSVNGNINIALTDYCTFIFIRRCEFA